MTAEEQLLDALRRMKFLRADAQRLHDVVVDQGWRSEEQDAEMEMMRSLVDETEAEVEKLTAFTKTVSPNRVETVHTCRHCGNPVQRYAGMWVHTAISDFNKCRRAGIPRSSRGEL